MARSVKAVSNKSHRPKFRLPCSSPQNVTSKKSFAEGFKASDALDYTNNRLIFSKSVFARTDQKIKQSEVVKSTSLSEERARFEIEKYSINQHLDNLEKLGVGDCGERSLHLARHLILDLDINVTIDIMKLDGGDHAFVQMNRGRKDSLILDPWTNQHFKAKESDRFLFNPKKNSVVVAYSDKWLREKFQKV